MGASRAGGRTSAMCGIDDGILEMMQAAELPTAEVLNVINHSVIEWSPSIFATGIYNRVIKNKKIKNGITVSTLELCKHPECTLLLQ